MSRTLGIKFQPSSAERWMTCTASVQAVANAPAPPSTVFANEGTVAHWVLERAGNGETPALGDVHPDIPAHPVDAEMLRCAADSLAYIQRVVRAWKPLVFQQHELRVPISIGSGRVQTGIVDYVAITEGGVVLVMDYKYGKGVKVHAAENPQLLLYTVGAAQLALELGRPVTGVELHIVQPRIDHYDSWSCTREELEQFWLRVANAVGEALSGNGKFVPSREACRWCPISGTCRARSREAHKALAPKFLGPGSEPIPEHLISQPRELSPEELAVVLRDVPRIRDWCNAVEAKMRELVEAALHSTGLAQAHGFKLRAGRSTRSWVSPEAAKRAFRRLKLAASEYTVKSLLSVAQAEKKVGKKRFETAGKTAVKMSVGAPALVPDTDPGQPLSGITTAEAFGINQEDE